MYQYIVQAAGTTTRDYQEGFTGVTVPAHIKVDDIVGFVEVTDDGRFINPTLAGRFAKPNRDGTWFQSTDGQATYSAKDYEVWTKVLQTQGFDGTARAVGHWTDYPEHQ